MEQGHGRQEHVPGLIPRPARIDPAGEELVIVAVGQLHALGQTRGARRIELDDVVILLRGQVRIGCGILPDPVLQGWPTRMARLDLNQVL